MDCYVLAGGLSRRMGRPKIDLFLGRVTEAARVAFGRVFAVRRPGDAPLPDIETIFEPPHEGTAPVFGVLAALRHARDRCFVMAVDYPMITAEVLAFLRDAGGVPVWRGKPQVLCATYEAALADRIEQRLGEGRLDLRGLIEEAGAAMIPEAELRARFAGEPLMNVNTPQELEEAERIYGRFLASR
jgi:molybdopterin-guanine dinucleotide biosynthesis protein A